jgi:outer membrane protein assembly factor BamA
VEEPVIAADLEVGPGSVALEGFPAVTGIRVRAHAEEGWVELREGAASYQGAALTATGRAPVSLFLPRAGGATGNLELRAQATGVTPAVMEPFLDPSTLEQLSGSVDVALDAASPTLDIADLTGELRLDRLEIRLADLPVTQKAPTRIVARDGLARIEAWDWAGQGATLTVRGQVRLSDRQSAILANGDLDVRMLTPFVRAAGITTAGRLEPRLSITGAIDSPRIDGDAILTGGEVRLNDPRILMSDLAARAVLTGNSLRLTSLTGQVNGGPLTGGGELSFTRDSGMAARLTAETRGMALEFPEGLRSEANAALELVMADPPGEGPGAMPAGRVSGTVTVVRGAYREPMAVVTGMLATLRARRLAAGSAAGPSPLLESLALDVRLLTDEDLIVDNNYGRFQLGADLRVIGTAAAPSLSGRAELREGGQLFVGRNVYTISTGTIDFTNPVIIEPELNLVATTRAGGEDIELQITGTPNDPDISPRSTSDPSLGEAEVVSLLLTGRRLEDLAPGDAAFVGTQVLGNFSAEVLGFASRAVGLDTVRLGGVETTRRDPTAVATEVDPTTRLTFGKSFGTNVDVTFSQSLRDNDAQTWIVDYLPSRRLVLRLVSNDDNLRSYEFRHDVTFGGAGPALVASQGVSRPQAARVAAVSVTGALVFPEDQVRDVLRLDVGDRFDFADWQEDRDRLEAFYRAQGYLTVRVTPARSEGGDGMSLVYAITPGPQTRIEVSGIDLDGTLRSRLETAWSESVFDDFLVEEATAIVQERLAQDGYLQPTVDISVASDASTKTLVVNVERGNRTTDLNVRVEGADEALSEEIQEWLDMRTAGIGLLPAQAGAVSRDLAAYLRSLGYLRAEVTVGAPAFEGASATVPVKVVPGPIFTVAGVSFIGAGAVAMDTLSDTADIESGSSYDPALADAARDRLVALYRREGFPVPSVTVQQMVYPETPFVDLAFAIDPGRRQVIGEVVVSGNRAIDTDVIVRALQLSPDRPLRTEESLQARRRVFDTGLFRRVDLSTEAMEQGPGIGDGGSVPMRVSVTVEEWPAVRLRYGFQVAEERPETEIDGRTLAPGLSADLTRRTLFGKAIATGGAVQLQRRERLGRAFINAPTLFGWPLESSLSVDRTSRTIAGTDRIDDRSGISGEQRIRLLSDTLQLSYGYRLERSRTEIPTDPILGSFPPIIVDMGRLVAAASWDRRDDPYDARSGFLASSSLEYSPKGLGSDIRFVRFLAQGYSFRSWREVVFASAARSGTVRALDDQDLLASEQFFAGGATTVRGLAEDTLGGVDFFGSPIGGEAFIVLNQEVRVPLFGWVRGVGFIDAGTVAPRIGDFRWSSLVGSAGVGLRVATPFALLRVDYARPVWGGPVAQARRWTFGIGNTF